MDTPIQSTQVVWDGIYTVAKYMMNSFKKVLKDTQ